MSNSAIGRKPIPGILLEKRRVEAMKLKMAGFSNLTIIQTINDLDDENGWGNISARTLQRDISKMFQSFDEENGFSDKASFQLCKNTYLSQIEHTIDRQIQLIGEKDIVNDWNPYEKQNSIKKLFDMQCKMFELRGYSLERNNDFAKTNQIYNAIGLNEQAKKEFSNPETAKALEIFANNLEKMIEVSEEKNE